MDDNSEFAAFARDVDRALKRLYDPAALRSSPLIGMLRLPAKAGPADLRQALLNAIEALRPQGEMAEQGKAWRIYQVLFQRFVGQFSQVDVAHTLNLSIRQMAREESRAAQALADYLWSRHAVDQSAVTGPLAQEKSPPSRDEEIQWLQQSLPTEAISVEETIQAALATLAPLLKHEGVTAEMVSARPLARVAGQSGVLRQAVLNALSVACRSVPGGKVRISAGADGPHVSIRIQPVPGATPANLSSETPESIAMITRLLGLLGGEVAVSPGAAATAGCGAAATAGCGAAATDAQQPPAIHLTLPAAQQLPILVIDDNADTLQLYERYLANSRYLFYGRSDPLQTLDLARSVQPHIIVLDVMLPGMDGWELLQRLRAEPATSAIPIVVCSILLEQPLAEAMGAAAYLRKPVSREDFLATLGRLAARPAPESPA